MRVTLEWGLNQSTNLPETLHDCKAGDIGMKKIRSQLGRIEMRCKVR